MATKLTWKPHTEHGKLSSKDRKSYLIAYLPFPSSAKNP
jgi:hypothetical protein